MAQTPVIISQCADTVPYLATGDKTAGDVVIVGTIPAVVKRDIDYSENPLGSVSFGGEEIWMMPQAAEIITAGDAVYWDADGNPYGGTAGSGCVTATASGNSLIGTAAPRQPNGTNATAATDSYVNVLPNAAKRTATLGGSVTADSLTIDGAGGITLSGTTGQPKVVLTTNLADALSIIDGAGDLIVVATTTGSQVITVTPALTVTGLVTSNGGITISGAVDLTFSGTTGQPEIVVPDNLADALSVKDAGGGADIFVIVTTNSAECVAYNVPIRLKTVTTAVAAAGSTVADAGQLSRSNIVHVSSDGATKGVKLATGVKDDWIWIINDSGTACELYAASGGTINGLAADASVVIPASKGVWCQCTAADTWIAFDLPAKATAS